MIFVFCIVFVEYFLDEGVDSMKRIYIFGSGSTGRSVYNDVKKTMIVLGFLDNDPSKWGGSIEDIPIVGNGQSIKNEDFDEILVCSLTGMKAIQKQLIEIGIPSHKINCEHISTQVNARINFLEDFSNLHKDICEDISIAEGGVFQGDFAKDINRCFPNNKFYLFDTFEGFDERDTKKEHKEGFSIFEKNHLNITSVELVLGKMPYPEMVEARKGYFPETANGLENERFFFVNLDFDLYNPTLEGLRFFYPRLDDNGVMLIHDYYNPGYFGVKSAIDDFEKERGFILKRFPIGDHCSIAIIK